MTFTNFGTLFIEEDAYAPMDPDDRLVVNGTLDLSAAEDWLIFQDFGSANIGDSFVVATYQTRIGEFVNGNAQPNGIGLRPISITYTSPSGDGPGQVIVTMVPEPAALLMGAMGLTAILMQVSGRRNAAKLNATAADQYAE